MPTRPCSGGDIIPELRGAIISEARGGFVGISIDDKPRDVDPGDMKLLVELAHLVETLIAARSSATYAWPDAGHYAGAAGYSDAARCGAAGGLNYMLGIFP